MTDETPEPLYHKLAIIDATGKILRTAWVQSQDADKQAGEGEEAVDVSDYPETHPGLHQIDLATMTPVARVTPLGEIKAKKDVELAAACRFTICAGFVSGAFIYPSFKEDQENLATMRDSGGMVHRQDQLTGVWSFDTLSAAQVQAVLADFVTHRDAQRLKLNSLRAGLALASTPEAVEAISWD